MEAKAGKDFIVQHKESSFRIVPVLRHSKLERLAALPPLEVFSGSWEKFQKDTGRLSRQMQREWKRKWDRRLAK